MEALSVNELCNVLTDVCYKNWKFWIEDVFGCYLCMEVPTVCARSGEPLRVRLSWQLPKKDFRTQREFERYVFRKIVWFEQHEAGEFFRVGARRPYDPHKRKREPPPLDTKRPLRRSARRPAKSNDQKQLSS